MIDKNELVSRVSRLAPREKMHILNILKSNGVVFTKNKNGYFFNLSQVEPSILEKIHNCLVLIEKNRDILSEMDKRREELIHYYKKVIEERLKESLQMSKRRSIEMLYLKPIETAIVKRIIGPQKIPSTEHIDSYLLFQNYIKSKRYDKKTIYGKIKAIIRNKKRKTKMISATDNNHADTLVYFDADGGDHDGGEQDADETESHHGADHDDEVADDPDDEVAGEADNEVEGDADADEETVGLDADDEVEGIPDAEGEDMSADISEHEDADAEDEVGGEVEDADDGDSSILSSDLTSEQLQKLMFYKRLLYEQGIIFQDNLTCELVRQHYIP
jgi:hypothetical protein